MIGSILIAFGPTFSLLLLLISSKPQLVILAICAAFAYLLSALASSLLWLILTCTFGPSLSIVGTVLGLSVTGVACQMMLRCSFVAGYFNIEAVIRQSVSKHEGEVAAAANYAAGYTAGSSTNDDGNDDDDANNDANGTAASSAPTTNDGSRRDEHATNNHGTTATANTTNTAVSETEALQLQLNDLSCSLASGVGYAILHSLFLYGTLLASEGREYNSYDDAGSYVGGGGSTGYGGTLYQDSCGAIPSLLHGALIAVCFSLLDVAWMMLCFYGMRRIIQQQSSSRHDRSFIPPRTREGVGVGRSILLRTLTCHGFDDDDDTDTDSTTSSGYTALLFVTITHLLASLVLTFNSHTNGCVISLPCLAMVVLWVVAVLCNIVRKDRFLPVDQKSRIMTMRRRQQQQQQQMSGGTSNENGMNEW